MLDFKDSTNVLVGAARRPSLRFLTAATALTWAAGLAAPGFATFCAIAVIWLAFGWTILVQLFKAGQIGLAAIPVFFVAVIAVGVSLPGEWMSQMLQMPNSMLAQINSPISASKIGHIFCFAMLTLFLLAIRRRLRVRAKELIVFVILLAVATEGLQLFLPVRTTSFLDVCFDLAGAVIGFCIFAVYKRLVPERPAWLSIRSYTSRSTTSENSASGDSAAD